MSLQQREHCVSYLLWFYRLQCTSLLLAADVCSERLHNSVTDRTTQQLDINESLHVRIAAKWHSAVLEIVVDNL